VPVRPVVHYAMGGVHTDIDGATPIPGLFAAGEVACVSINGANRLGSNSLPELFVFGTRAGRAAAWYTLRAKEPTQAVVAQAADERRRLEDDVLGREGGEDRISAIRTAMQSTMEDSAGIYRSGDSLAKGPDALPEPRGRLPRPRDSFSSLPHTRQVKGSSRNQQQKGHGQPAQNCLRRPGSRRRRLCRRGYH